MATRMILQLLKFLAVLAERDAKRAAERDARFKKRQAKREVIFRQAARRAELKAADLRGEVARCSVAAALGDAACQQKRLDANCLAAGLRSVGQQSHKSLS